MDEEDEILRTISRLMYRRRGRTIYSAHERQAARERILRIRPWEIRSHWLC